MASLAPARAQRPERSTTPTRSSRSRLLLGLVVLVGLLGGLVVASLAIGSKPLGLGDVWDVLWHPDGSQASTIVHDLRIPRTVLGILVGIALGMSGTLMQGHTRNPLADPGLLGVTAGAALAVVAAIKFLHVDSPLGYVWFSMIGAVVASVVVYAIGTGVSGNPSPLSLVLAGSAVSAFLLSMVTVLLVNDAETINSYRFWIVGSLDGRGMGVVREVAPFVVVGALLAIAHAPALNLLSLGDDVARSLGQHVGLARTVGLFATMLLAGAATAACGPIAFLGLIVPHLVRWFTGPDYRFLMPYAGLAGACLLLLSDVLGRVVARPGELQVGVVLALVGGPFFIALVRRKKLTSL
ncbi:iron complex transport system permease protein [Marmoricola sp. OAE513]|uniref:FecCD family ABC transporter permease n=1 Tax=Marmoricola sp. OAE513 TaxID=2817894 RepID=UPI001AE1B06A